MVASAGLVMYRRGREGPEVLLVHPGGPFFRRRHQGAWSIPKGLVEAGEEPLEAACREFREETGVEPAGDFLPLGTVRQKGGKVVHAWAVEGDLDASEVRSGTFELEWPPRSGTVRSFPEIDEARFVSLTEAREILLPAQLPLLERLEEALRRKRPAGGG